MTLRLLTKSLTACVFGAVSLLAIDAQAQRGGATLNYEGADLAAVTRDISLRTGRIFVTDPRLSGKVNIVSPPDLSLSPDEVWQVFLATLQVNGFSAVPIGDREYKIVPSQQAVREGGGAPGGASSTVTRVIPLRHVGVMTAASNLRGLVGETGLVTPIAESNAMVVVDTPANVARIVDLVRQIDVDNSVVRTVPLVNAAASDVANTLLEIITRQPSEGRGAGQVNVVAVDASNTIILRGNPGEVNRLLPLVKELDQKGAGRMALDTIYLNHADAEEIVPLLQQLIDNSFGGADGVAPVGGFKPSVGFHKGTNALIINGSPEVQRTMRSIVGRLDIRRPQVLIEAVVVEISNTTARELGVQYLTGGEGVPLTASGFTNTTPNLVSAAGAAYFLSEDDDNDSRTTVTIGTDGTRTEVTEPVDSTAGTLDGIADQLVEAAVGDLLGLNGFMIGAGGQTSDGSVYGALLSAIQSDGQSNVLSVPSITLLDNETALLQVGQEIPIVTGQASGADFQNSFRTVERKDVGNILEVTPQINKGNTVQLKIRLEVSSIGAFTSLTEDIITNKSTIETVALAEDGQTLVLGGLIDQDRRDTESKVPLLGDIPLLGNLFKGQTSSNEESTLMVFIRPTILRDAYSADSITARKYDYVRQQQRQDGRKNDRVLDDVLKNYLGPGDYFIPGAAQQGGAPTAPAMINSDGAAQ